MSTRKKTVEAVNEEATEQAQETAADGDITQANAGTNETAEQNARIQGLMIVLGMISRNYARNHVTKFIDECLQLNLVEELMQAQKDGEKYFEKRIPAEAFDRLLSYLIGAQGTSGETDAG